MTRLLPPTWAPATPPAPTRLERWVDALFELVPGWDQAAVLGAFLGYLGALCALAIHLA